MLRPGETLIHAQNWQAHAALVPTGQGRGLIPRDYDQFPRGCYSALQAVDFPTIPRSEWSERARDQAARGQRLSDVMLAMGVPCLDQNGKGYCNPPMSLIRMADGSQKPIKDMRMLDEVVSGEGRVRRVMQLHVREYEGDMVTVKAWGHGHLQLTPNHKVMTKRGYVEAGELTADDWIAAPKYAPRSAAVVQVAPHLVRDGVMLRAKAGDGGAGDWRGGEGQPAPDFICLTRGVGRILGMWLAEGCIKDNREAGVVWSFGTERKMRLVEELIGLLRDEWGVEAHASPGPVPSVTNVVLAGKTWSRLLESLLGRRAGGKRLHADLTAGPTEFLEGLFWGWMDCDGCARSTPRRKDFRMGCTVSHALAMNMYDIANHLGLCPTVCKEKPQVNGAAKTRQAPWKVKVIPEPGDYRPNYRMQSEDGRVWRKVYAVEREPYSGLVYNIGVEVDNSYIAEGIWVKNCWAHSTTGAVQAARAVMNEPTIGLSAYSVACKIKGFRDQGGWGAQSAEFIAANGVADETAWPQRSMSRALDNPATWENAKRYRLSVQLADMAVAQYNRGLTFEQYATCWLLDCPTVDDWNWWAHSTMGCDLVEGASCWGICRSDSGKMMTLAEFNAAWDVDTDPVAGGWGHRIRNSWGSGWSQNGFGVLAGSKAVPDGGVGVMVVTASAAA
jgi:hypothetical protein